MSQFRREGQEEPEYAIDRGDGHTPRPATVPAG
jgi:hypothetical protein